jgi:D-alanyl-D-alanine endopeptidase (penicillin-binding protein 7)
MNAKAKQLGMKNTTYVDPTGLSNRNQSTARDLAVLVGAVAQEPQLREFSTTPTHLAALGGRTLQYNNSNRLVRNQRAGWDIELQKTGYIVEAGRCLTMLTKVAGRDLVMVLLDADSNGTRIADAERMRRWLVARWGVPETFAQAKADAPVRKLASAKKKKTEAKGKAAVVAGKATSPKKGAGRTAVASAGKQKAKDAAKKDGRVRQTFAAGRQAQKS